MRAQNRCAAVLFVVSVGSSIGVVQLFCGSTCQYIYIAKIGSFLIGWLTTFLHLLNLWSYISLLLSGAVKFIVQGEKAYILLLITKIMNNLCIGILKLLWEQYGGMRKLFLLNKNRVVLHFTSTDNQL